MFLPSAEAGHSVLTLSHLITPRSCKNHPPCQSMRCLGFSWVIKAFLVWVRWATCASHRYANFFGFLHFPFSLTILLSLLGWGGLPSILLTNLQRISGQWCVPVQTVEHGIENHDHPSTVCRSYHFAPAFHTKTYRLASAFVKGYAQNLPHQLRSLPSPKTTFTPVPIITLTKSYDFLTPYPRDP